MPVGVDGIAGTDHPPDAVGLRRSSHADPGRRSHAVPAVRGGAGGGRAAGGGRLPERGSRARRVHVDERQRHAEHHVEGARRLLHVHVHRYIAACCGGVQGGYYSSGSQSAPCVTKLVCPRLHG